MGTAVLRGISASLLVTVVTLLAGMFWNSMGFGGLSVSTLVDIGLVLSCLVGGYRTGKESRFWLLGGVAGAGYVGVGALLLALFLPLRAGGVLQIMLEGAVLGLIAGAVGAGGRKGFRSPAVFGRARRSDSWGNGEEQRGWDEPAEDRDSEDWELDGDASPERGGLVDRSESLETIPAWRSEDKERIAEDWLDDNTRPESGQDFKGKKDKGGFGMGEWQLDPEPERKQGLQVEWQPEPESRPIWEAKVKPEPEPRLKWEDESKPERKRGWKTVSGRKKEEPYRATQFRDKESTTCNERQVVPYPGRSPWWEEEVGQGK